MRFKYGADTPLVRVLANHMATSWVAHGVDGVQCLVPVPLHWAKQLKRGYNQSALLCEQLSSLLGLPTHTLLRRTRWTRSQASLDLTRRKRNLRNAFSIRRSALAVQHVLLVDDVMTTGSTLEACCKALKRGGVPLVSVLTAARG